MKNFLKKLIEFLIDLLTRIKIWIERNKTNPNPNQFEDLTPIDKVEDEKYIESLRWALKNEKVKNIAITGPFGSGKSSILSTFKSNHQEYNYLNISLASFSEDNNHNGDINRLIERSILQQIFYGVKAKIIPDSRFKRIKSLNIKKLLTTSILLIIWGLSTLVIITPKFLSTNNFYKELIPVDNQVFTYIVLGVFFLGLLKIVLNVLRIFNNAKFNKLNIKSGEIELNSNIESSILNKHLDEILYFFEVTQYDVVIIEDLDRFNNSDIFTKLREMNLLINNSKQIGRRIVFIYAVKDDLFKDKKSRTKFFDFIIPVIPVINSSNSGELLSKKFNEANIGELLSKSFISDISLYIDDMRILKNIYNEFIIYKDKLGNIGLNPEKLFSIIIYKNLYPEDFAKLHSNEGLIFELFANKSAITAKVRSQYEDRLNIIKSHISKAKNEKVKSVKELRQIYLGVLASKLEPIYRLILNNNKHELKEIIKDNVFNELKRQSNIKYATDSYSYSNQNSGISFEDIDKEINPNSSYDEREQSVIIKETTKEENLKTESETILKELKILESLPLKELLKKSEFESELDEKIKKERIIYYLIRNGYIDEMYHSFISYFYEGSLSKADMDFVFSVKDSITLDASHKITNIEEVLKKLRLNEYSQKEILNFSILEYLLNNTKNYKNEFQAILTQLANQNTESLEFIDGFIDTTKNIESFIFSLCNTWTNIWSYIENDSNFSTSKKNKYLKLILEYGNISDLREINRVSKSLLTKYISNMDSFLTDFQSLNNISKIKEVLLEFNIKFKKLKSSTDSKELLNYVYDNNLYEINIEMISFILANFGKDSIYEFDKSNYTLILNSGCDKLAEYISQNIDIYISQVFLNLENNTEEKENTIIDLLNNELIDIENKERIIQKESVRIVDITDIITELWASLLLNSKVESNWDNLIAYYEREEIDEDDVEFDNAMIIYLNKKDNYQILSNKKLNSGMEISEELAKKISKDIVLCNELSDNSYAQILKSIPYVYNSLSFEDLSTEKVSIMVNSDFLNLTESNFEILKDSFSPLQISLLEKNIREFLSNESEITIDSDDLLLLLKSEHIKSPHKITLIKELDIESITFNVELSNAVISNLLPAVDFEIEFEVLKELVTHSSSIENRIKIFNEQIDYLSFNQITSLLKLLPKPYYDISQKGHRPKLTISDYNELFIDKLNELEYISSYKTDKGKIRVNTRRY